MLKIANKKRTFKAIESPFFIGGFCFGKQAKFSVL